MSKHIAIDLGASNGRVIVGNLDEIEVVHRFITQNERVLGETYWDLLYIFSEIKKGIKIAIKKYGSEITSLGVDTWGVDYVLVDQIGAPVSLPYHYRDSRTDGMIEEVSKKISKQTLFDRTGIAFQPFNTLYQLYAMKKYRASALKIADRYLSIPDIITYWLSGVMSNEITHASTTQLFNPHTYDWDDKTIDELDFDRGLFHKVIKSGTIVGTLETTFQKELNIEHTIKVIAVATHDTASAVAAVPTSIGKNPLYISSGTWSLLGVEIDQPITSLEALQSGFTNEIGVNDTIRFLKNIMGMWIQQECVRHWQNLGEEINWKALDDETVLELDYQGYIDPLDNIYLKPNTPESLMVDRVIAGCVSAGFDTPKNHGQIMVAIYRGLARAYKNSIEEIERITHRSYPAIHVIGGGCKNEILNQLTADITKKEVYAGPVEATALGNLLLQMIATQEIKDIQEGRDIIIKTQKVRIFSPR